MMAHPETTYDEVRRALDEDRLTRGQFSRAGDAGGGSNGSRWPSWINTAIAVAMLITTILGAYFSLDKRMSLLEQKLDYIVYKVQK